MSLFINFSVCLALLLIGSYTILVLRNFTAKLRVIKTFTEETLIQGSEDSSEKVRQLLTGLDKGYNSLGCRVINQTIRLID